MGTDAHIAQRTPDRAPGGAAGTTLFIPTLRTARLVLRAPKAADFDAYAAFRVSERSRGVGGPYTRDEAYLQFCELVGHWMIRGFGRWMVADPETDAALGVVGLYYPEDWPEPEIAWAVFENAEGRGVAHEAACAARAFAYDTLGWTTVISCIMPGNTRSIALARRMGCVEDGSHRLPDLGPLMIWRHPGPETLA